MNPRIRVIKHGDERVKGQELDRLEESSLPTAQEITTTIKLWVSEFRERRRVEEQRSRSAHKLAVTGSSLMLVLVFGTWTLGSGQQLRDAFHKVKQSVVIVRTQQRNLAPSAQGGTVSANGLGSGVLISSEGKVLTAPNLFKRRTRRWSNSQMAN
jgi:hypothetical protein